MGIEVCDEKGIEPRRSYSGKFNLRISPELHEQLAITAQATGKSVNFLAQEALKDLIANRVNKSLNGGTVSGAH